MYILLITRGIPEPQDPQWGCFEKDQAEALVALGHKVVCLSVDGRFRRYKRKIGTTHVTINGVEYYNWYLMPTSPLSRLSHKLSNKYTFLCAHHLFKQILTAHGRPDVIYAEWAWNMLIGLKIRQKYNIPVVGIEHNGAFGLGWNEPRRRSTMERGAFVFTSVDALITVSKNLQAGIKKDFGVDSVVIPNLVGGDFTYHAPIKHDSFTFVSLGTLVYGKGYDIIINALRSVPNKNDIHINIIGDGPLRGNLQAMIEEYGLVDNVKLLGYMQKPQIVEIMQQSDAFVFGTRYENFSVAILEALSQGLPSIVTDCGGARDCVNEANGIIIDVDNVEQMAEAMQRIVKNITHYDRRAIADDFQQRFSAASIARQITNVLEDVVNKYTAH